MFLRGRELEGVEGRETSSRLSGIQGLTLSNTYKSDAKIQKKSAKKNPKKIHKNTKKSCREF